MRMTWCSSPHRPLGRRNARQGASTQVLRGAAAGGKLLIAEYVPNDTRTGPAMPLLLA